MSFLSSPASTPSTESTGLSSNPNQSSALQMQWTVTPHREHMHYLMHVNYQNIIWTDIKTLLLLCQSIKKEKKKPHPSLKLLTIQNWSRSMNLLCLLPSSKRKSGKKGLTRDTYYLCHPQTKLKHMPAFVNIYFLFLLALEI